MSPILIIEIVSALISCGALIVLATRALRMGEAGKNLPDNKKARPIAGHRAAGLTLIAAGAVHGTAATLYASGARVETYVMGWASLALFVLSGICMAPGIRSRLAHAGSAHIACFALGAAFFIIHAVLGRM